MSRISATDCRGGNLPPVCERNSLYAQRGTLTVPPAHIPFPPNTLAGGANGPRGPGRYRISVPVRDTYLLWRFCLFRRHPLCKAFALRHRLPLSSRKPPTPSTHPAREQICKAPTRKALSRKVGCFFLLVKSSILTFFGKRDNITKDI